MISGMKQHNQRGAVSIFVVIFSAMFVTIITVSFVSLMIRAQQQAANADLSNSAYDSALAGVEDAKRVLLEYRKCAQGGFAGPRCNSLKAIVEDTTPECDMVRRALTGETDGAETLIESTNGSDINSRALDQAYTCAQVKYTDIEKVVQILDGESTLIPIDANGADYNTVNISWFTRSTVDPKNLELPMYNSTTSNLPSKLDWLDVGDDNTVPPILRMQLIQYSGQFSASDFDYDVTSGADVTANTKTGFLYPSQVVGQTSYDTQVFDDRRSTDPDIKTLKPVICDSVPYMNGSYACSVDIKLPAPVNDSGVRTAFLQLQPFYNDTRVRIVLKQDSTVVDMVAPTVDVTGRANDLFRRIKAGVSFEGEYPRATFDLQGNLCKDFSVTTDAPDYSIGRCDPDNP